MWRSPKLIPIEERGAFKGIAMGLVLMLAGVTALYYGNVFVQIFSERMETYNFSPLFFGAIFSVLVHGLQVLLLFLSWISIGDGVSRLFGRQELAARLIVSSMGIWTTWIVFPLLSGALEYSFSINFYVMLLLMIFFEVLTQHVENWVDKSAAMMLWVYSFQSLELMPTFMPDGRAASVFFDGMFRTSEEIAIASVAGASLFLSFMAGGAISTWVLASYSIKLSQVRRSWIEGLSSAGDGEDEGLRKVSMVDLRSLVHDLKTPIAAVKGMAFMLRDDLKNSGGDVSGNADSEKIGIMLDATNYMERVVSEILHEDRLQRVQVGAFFDRLDRYVRPFPWGEDVTVSIDPDAEKEFVALNEIRFTRALLNLLDNAWRANRTAGDKGIELRARRSATFLEIEILDNGPGVIQGLSRPKSGWGSTGLGLAFARKVVIVHGGSLMLSQRMDAPHGASVLISLPILDAGL